MSIRGRVSRLSVFLAAVMVLPGLFAAVGAEGEDPVDWTVAIYVSGDNDLEKYWEQYSLPGVLNIPASESLKIVAVMDRLSTQGTEIIEISGGTQSVVATLPEMNFGDGATFAWFIDEVTLRYPSEHLAVVAWDHGYSWRYFSRDDSSGGDRITMPEFRSALVDAGEFIDVLSFDCCNMAAIEVAYEASLTGMVGYMVASEETIPMNGFPYDLMFTPVALDTTRTPDMVAVDMVDGWEQYYDPLNWATTVGLSAVDIGVIASGHDILKAWTGLISEDLPLYAKAYKNAVHEAYAAWATHYHVDLADLGDVLLADESITDEALKAATAELVALIDSATLDVWGGKGAEAMRGLTLWWASKSDWSAYSAQYTVVSFANDMGWYAFLEEYTA